MRALNVADVDTFKNVRFILTDMDDTLTFQGKLSADTYTALERLQKAGFTVIPVTAAPSGWCDQMARMWPVDGVIGENGGIFFRRQKSEPGGVKRAFWHDEDKLPSLTEQLRKLGEYVKCRVPLACFADDQPYRLSSVAFVNPQDPHQQAMILDALHKYGAEATVNNLWILGWIGRYDKLEMSRKILLDYYQLDIDAEREAVLYCGDSTNDAPMFSFFEHTVGVSTVSEYLHQIPQPPRWITQGPGGVGFVEIANTLIASR